MKHFSASVDFQSSIEIGIHEATSGDVFVHCQRALIIAMDANPCNMSPSEEGVLKDFFAWFNGAKDDYLNGNRPSRPTFVYVNVNTGFVLVIVVTVFKGELPF